MSRITSVFVRIARVDDWSSRTVVWRGAWDEMSRESTNKNHKVGTYWTSLRQQLLKAWYRLLRVKDKRRDLDEGSCLGRMELKKISRYASSAEVHCSMNK